MSKFSQGHRSSNRSLTHYANSLGETDSLNGEETDNETTNEEAVERLLNPGTSSSSSSSPSGKRRGDPSSDASAAVHWPKKTKRRNLLLLSLASFVVSIGQSIIMPVIEDIGRELMSSKRKVAAVLVRPDLN